MACTSVKSQVCTVQYHPLCVKHYLVCNTAVLWTRLLHPDLGLYKCKEFSAHGAISSVVFQNIIITAVYLSTVFSFHVRCMANNI